MILLKRSLFIFTFGLSILFSRSVIALADITADGLTPFQIKQIFNRLESELVNLGQYDVTSRSEADKILKEVKFQNSGCTDQECAAKIGKLLNADLMILSNILYDTKSKEISLTLKLVDVETAKITTAITKDSVVSKPSNVNSELGMYLLELYRKANEGSVVQNFQQRENVGKGKVEIKSTPIGASVVFDNEHKGVTPLLLENINEGQHRLILSMEGFERLNKSVIVLADSQIVVSEVLSERTGHLQVLSEPINCEVYLDDQYKGNTPATLQYLDVGSYMLKLNKVGFEDYIKRVNVEWNQTKTIVADLVPEPASIVFYSVPNGATVYMDGKDVGKTKPEGLIVNVQHGKHKVSMKLKGHSERSQHFEVSPGENTSYELQLSKLPEGVSDDPNAGWVSINCWPEDANIKLRGNYYPLPLRYFELKNGSYNFTASKAGYLNKKIPFTVVEQKLTKTDFRLSAVDRDKARKNAMLFPGLGHIYAEQKGRGFMWSILESAAIFATYSVFNTYQDKLKLSNEAYNNYNASSNHEDINANRILYDEAFTVKNNHLYATIGIGTVAVAVWVWNVFDVEKVIPQVRQFPKDIKRELDLEKVQNKTSESSGG